MGSAELSTTEVGGREPRPQPCTRPGHSGWAPVPRGPRLGGGRRPRGRGDRGGSAPRLPEAYWERRQGGARIEVRARAGGGSPGRPRPGPSRRQRRRRSFVSGLPSAPAARSPERRTPAGGAGRGLSRAARRSPAPRTVAPVPCPTPSTLPQAAHCPRSAAALPLPAAAYRARAKGDCPGRQRPKRLHS